MKRALRCLGYVLFGIICVALAAVVLFAGVGALMWISVATAVWLDLPAQYGPPLSVGYFVLLAGCCVGVSMCREDRA